MACELTVWKDAQCLDTLAAAYFELGDYDSAVKWQAEANALQTDAAERKRGKALLEGYRKWLATSMKEAPAG